ncbi:MAG: phosphate ABC transporter permease subunit PstC [Planctomycetaceae bacterium]|nr:phosphate ABC transporter permease subunit PstC [Planctomycetaceae bacterium]
MSDKVHSVSETLCRKSSRKHEKLIQLGLFTCALISVLTTAAIMLVLFMNSVWFPGENKAFFEYEEVHATEFATGTHWNPRLGDDGHFGILPLLNGTMIVALIAVLFSVPVGLCSAVYLSEYARPTERALLKPVLEVLAGIPTVIYGFFGLRFITPYVIRPLFEDLLGIPVGPYNVLSAGLVVGIMVTPMIASLSEDVIRSVPRSLREAGYALGATRFDVSARIVVPAALSGILAACLLAFARAIGETMAVTIAGGNQVTFSGNPLEPMRTMTAYMVAQSINADNNDPLQAKSVFAVGMALFAVTLLINLGSQWIMRRFREVYQ